MRMSLSNDISKKYKLLTTMECAAMFPKIFFYLLLLCSSLRSISPSPLLASSSSPAAVDSRFRQDGYQSESPLYKKIK